MLSSFASANFAGSSTAPIVNSVHHRIVAIAKITSTTLVGVFYIEAEMSITDDIQDFCMLECSGCKQKKRTKERKQFDCPKCQRKTILVPRCTFQIDLIDGNDSITASISCDLAETFLSMTAEDIHDTTCVKYKFLSVDHVQQLLSKNYFIFN